MPRNPGYRCKLPSIRLANGAVRLRAVLMLLLGLWCGTGCRQFTANGNNCQGTALYQQGNYEAARQQFQQALQRDPRNADTYYNLAVVQHHVAKQTKQPADYQAAETLYNQCLDRNGNHVDCYRGLSVLLIDEKRNQDAFKLLEGWVKRAPTQADARIELARLYDENGQRDAAKQYLQQALSVDPNNPRALAALGRIYEEAGDPQQALAVYQRSLQHNRLQTDVAARVNALQARVASLPPSTSPIIPLPTTPLAPAAATTPSAPRMGNVGGANIR